MCVSQAHELGRHMGCTSESGVLMNTEALSFIDHVATNSTERISSAGAAVRLSSSKSSVKIALSKASGPRILLSLFFTLSSSEFALFGQSWILQLNASGRIALFPGRYVILKLKPARNFNYRICF
jgi:hypothetical protein